MLSEKQAFSAGEQVMSPVMEKKNPKPKTNKTAFSFDVEIANASDKNSQKSSNLQNRSHWCLHQSSPACLTDSAPGGKTWTTVIWPEAIPTVSSRWLDHRLKEQRLRRKVELHGSSQPF